MKLMIKNDSLIPYDQSLLPSGKGIVYEVIRVIDRKPLFFKGHFLRLKNSIDLTGKSFDITLEKFKKITDKLIASIEKNDYNIKVLINSDSNEIYIFENPSSYPPNELYKNGIHTEIFKYVRQDPNAKIVNLELTEQAKSLMEKTNSYEVLLEDTEGAITEGSKSNVFFIKGTELITPPLDKVLPGITRQEIIKCAAASGFKVSEEQVYSSKLGTFDAAFISGTSPKILPISSIGQLKLSVKNNGLTLLMANFEDHIKEDLESYNSIQS